MASPRHSSGTHIRDRSSDSMSPYGSADISFPSLASIACGLRGTLFRIQSVSLLSSDELAVDQCLGFRSFRPVRVGRFGQVNTFGDLHRPL